ncbi:MAG TPA: helix-turn-helix domain-containing protein [Novosphingobium sp.]
MDAPSNFRRYALYGEDNGAIAPEFVHIEAISARATRYEGTIAPHTHPGIFQLLLLERGAGTLTGDGVRRDLAPAALAVLPSGSIHAFRFVPGTEGWVLSIATNLLGALQVSGQRRADLAALAQATALGLDPGCPAARRLGWLFREIAGELAEGHGGQLPALLLATLALLLTQVDALLAREARPTAVPVQPPDRGEQLVRRFRTLVDQHYRAGWPVARYAAQLGTTTPTLTRVCRRSLGRAPGEVVLDRLLLEAMRALTYSSSAISEIAHDLGFSDPAYFARFFRRRTGATASRFRRERLWLGGGGGGEG